MHMYSSPQRTRVTSNQPDINMPSNTTRKAPTASATEYDVGTRLRNLEGVMYEVVANKNGVHRWAKAKDPRNAAADDAPKKAEIPEASDEEIVPVKKTAPAKKVPDSTDEEEEVTDEEIVPVKKAAPAKKTAPAKKVPEEEVEEVSDEEKPTAPAKKAAPAKKKAAPKKVADSDDEVSAEDVDTKVKKAEAAKPPRPRVRKAPTEPAKTYEVGYQKVGISGLMYEVRADKNHVLRWYEYHGEAAA